MNLTGQPSLYVVKKRDESSFFFLYDTWVRMSASEYKLQKFSVPLSRSLRSLPTYSHPS